MVTIDEHLTELLLGEFLKERFSDRTIIHNKNLIVSNFAFHPDYFIPSLNLIIEFNGYFHYQDTKTVLKDELKRKILEENGYSLIEIPYFVQLKENTVIKFFTYFKDSMTNLKSYNTFEHGFHDKKALLPANYCYLGIQRFSRDLEYLGKDVEKDILMSLNTIYQNRIKKMKSYENEIYIWDTIFPYNITDEIINFLNEK